MGNKSNILNQDLAEINFFQVLIYRGSETMLLLFSKVPQTFLVFI